MERIPLFPLDLVVYPDEEVPLHVFEERYLLMVEECLEAGSPFGIALADPDQPEDRVEFEPVVVGTAVDVLAVDRLKDGRMLLAARGSRRFRIVRVVSERPYQEADVEWLDEPVGDSLEADRAEAAVRAELARVDAEDVVEHRSGPVDTSYAVAAALNAPLEIRQTILETETAADRLELERALLRTVETPAAAYGAHGADGAFGA